MNILCENAPRYYMHILLHLADRPPVPEGTTDFNIMQHFTAHGFSEMIGLPIASTYHALRWLEAAELIAPFPQPLRMSQQPARAYHLTRRGKQYAEALKVFKQTVEAL